MWMVLLYGVATFMETGVGVWMFGRMFPERKSSSEYRWAKMILLTLLILTTYTTVSYTHLTLPTILRV